MMKPYEYHGFFTVKYCDVDFKDELKPSVVLSLMEEVACASADELGFGYAFVKPRGYAFMVSNTCLEFVKPISIMEKITVKTWPLPPTFATFGREYQFVGEDQKTAVNASSRWCLIDMKSGKILPSKAIDNQDYSTYNAARVLENVQWKIPAFSREEGELKYSLTVANSEYDHNYHVNNTRYADYCFNCFTVAQLQEKKLKKFSISYLKQCKEGDVLSFYRKHLGEERYLVHGFNQKGEMVVQSQIEFV